MARKPIRSPFVVTVAVITGAALAGCGGQVAPGSSTSTPDSGTSPPPDSGTTPPVPGKTCPTSQPPVASACNVDSSVLCGYPSGSCGGTSLQCQLGVWKEVGGSTCNPPPVCPPVPYEGAPCTPGFGPCTYPDACPDRPSTEPAYSNWYCYSTTLHARDTTTDYVVMCPTVQPVHGQPCPCAGHYAGACSYGDCYGVPTVSARCDDKTQTWTVSEASCNPPAPELDAGSP